MERGFDLDLSCKLWLPFYKYGNETQKIYDMSGNENHATIIGAIPSSNIPNFKQCNCVLNGTFDSDTIWVKGTGWSIGGGIATKTAGVASDLEQNITTISGTVYYLKYTITRSAGSITPQIGGVSGITRSSSGTYSDYITTIGTENLKFQANNIFAGTIDNVIIQSISSFNGIGWYCDGVDDRFEINDFLCVGDNGKQVTVLSWEYSYITEQNNKGIISHWDQGINQRCWVIRTISAKNSFGVLVSTDGGNVNVKYYECLTPVNENKFNLYGFTFTNGTLLLYLNGVNSPVDKTTDVGFTTIHNPPVKLTISCKLSSGSIIDLFKGIHGESLIFNRALSNNEIRNYYELTRRRYGI